MDFVISKVALSVCALLVVSVLSGVLAGTNVLDDSSELKGVLRELCSLVDSSVRSDSESAVEWTVPTLSDGRAITIVLADGMVRGEARGHRDACQPAASFHLWRYDGEALNSSMVDQLDSDAPNLTIASGQAVSVTTSVVMYENELTLFAFVGL